MGQTKKNQILTKLQNANFDKTPKLKLGKKIQCSNCEKKNTNPMMTKLGNSNNSN